MKIVQRNTGTARATRLRIAALCFWLALRLDAASDPAANLLSAAASGQTRRVEMLLGAGTNLEAKDRNGRTPLMLAAQHGHAETVRLLLSKGAEDNARDADGFTAYSLAFFSPAHGVSPARVEEVLKALPRPSPVRLIVDAATNPEDLVSSCFMKSREGLTEFVNRIHLDAVAVSNFQDLLRSAGGGLIRIVRADRHGVTPATEPSRGRCRSCAEPSGPTGCVLHASRRRQSEPGDQCPRHSGSWPSGDFPENVRRRLEWSAHADGYESGAVRGPLSRLDARACRLNFARRRDCAHEVDEVASIRPTNTHIISKGNWNGWLSH